MARKPKPTKLNFRTAVSCCIGRLSGASFTVKALSESLSCVLQDEFNMQSLSMELLRREKSGLIVSTGETCISGAGRPMKVYRQKWVS